MGDRRTLRHRGHVLVVAADIVDEGTAFTLLFDGREIATHRHTWRDPNWRLDELDTGVDLASLGFDGARVQVSAWRRGRITAAHLVLGRGGAAGSALGVRPDRVPFEPRPGTAAHRRWAWAETHPRAHAARHVVIAIAQVATVLLGVRAALGFLFGWLPEIDLPRIPHPDLPAIPWPDVSFDVWPDWTAPGWFQAVLDARPYWVPVLVAASIATSEHRRRQRRRAADVEVDAGVDAGVDAAKPTEGGATTTVDPPPVAAGRVRR